VAKGGGVSIAVIDIGAVGLAFASLILLEIALGLRTRRARRAFEVRMAELDAEFAKLMTERRWP
jgi:hypothetical protein